ncbi:MAG: segregation/condensation protein A [Clostridia bacterium]|nr:segregation/condensation protein A [Clostridia bacterium]
MVNFKLESLTFEGPLDLLLHLLHKNKVSIYDIPIAQITAQYIEYVEQMQELDMEVTGEFLVMAAQLLLIKSRMLLPGNEETEKGEDPRTELVDRLIEYAKYKEAASFLLGRQYADIDVFYKEPDKIPLPKVKPTNEKIPLSKLLLAFEDVLERKREKDNFVIKREALETIVKRETVPVKTRIYHIYKRFAKKESLSFETLFADVITRAEAVSTFMAVLELMKRGKMSLTTENDKTILKLNGGIDDEEMDRIEAEE